MNRERIGKYVKRAGAGIAALSVVAMGVDNLATATLVNQAYPEKITPAEREDATKTVNEAESALVRIGVFVPEEIRASLRVTVVSSPQLISARQTIESYDNRSRDRSNYRAELRGSREAIETAGVMGGIVLMAIGNMVTNWRRMWGTRTRTAKI